MATQLRADPLADEKDFLVCGIQIRVSDRADDSIWDTFLMDVSHGHYTQSSVWAQVKSLLGWRTTRIIAEENHRIVGGAQILIRSIPFLGSIGYVPGGPHFLQDDPQIAEMLITHLYQIIKENHMQYLLVQPYRMWPSFEERLLERGFHHTERHALAVSTLLLDLTQDIDQILKSMRKSTRRNIRLSQKAGVIVREGNEGDLQSAYGIFTTFSKRHHLHIFSEEYFTGLWNILHPRGYLHLFIAEYEGEAVATSLLISFGRTVTDTMGAWNGLHAKAHPNEMLEWTAITWAKSQGYRFFDFDGLVPEVAKGEELPDAHKHGATFFKLGFGGRPVLYPVAYEYLPNGFLRWLYTTLAKSRATRLGLKSMEHFVRGMRLG
jgi:lipid II:glycine glycyltransferase (peptidoglycan interpeptide bridge formation enzyme)